MEDEQLSLPFTGKPKWETRVNPATGRTETVMPPGQIIDGDTYGMFLNPVANCTPEQERKIDQVVTELSRNGQTTVVSWPLGKGSNALIHVGAQTIIISPKGVTTTHNTFEDRPQ